MNTESNEGLISILLLCKVEFSTFIAISHPEKLHKKCSLFGIKPSGFLLDGNYGGASHHCGLDKNGALFYLISFDKSWAQSVILDLFLRIKSDRSLWPPFEFWRHCDSLLKKDCKKYFQLWCWWSVHDRGQ